MKIISFLGSPKKQGNTAVLLNKVLEGIHSKHDEQNEIVFLQEKNIKPCTECNCCQKDDKTQCVIDDDMQEIYKKVNEADLIITASPIYWWGVTAQTKLLIDRMYGFHGNLKNKKAVLLLTYGGELPNLGPETAESNYKEICEYLNIKNAGVLGVCTGKTEVSANHKALDEAYKFGQSI